MKTLLNSTPTTHDLYHGWFLNLADDGSASVWNSNKNEHIHLSQASLETLRQILNKSYRVS